MAPCDRTRLHDHHAGGTERTPAPTRPVRGSTDRNPRPAAGRRDRGGFGHGWIRVEESAADGEDDVRPRRIVGGLRLRVTHMSGLCLLDMRWVNGEPFTRLGGRSNQRSPWCCSRRWRRSLPAPSGLLRVRDDEGRGHGEDRGREDEFRVSQARAGAGHRAHEAVAVRRVSRHLRTDLFCGWTNTIRAGSALVAFRLPLPGRRRPVAAGPPRAYAPARRVPPRWSGRRIPLRQGPWTAWVNPAPATSLDPGYGPGRLLKAERLLPGVPGCRAGPCRGRGRGRGARYAKSPAPGSRGGAARGLFGGGSAVTGPGGSPRWPASGPGGNRSGRPVWPPSVPARSAPPGAVSVRCRGVRSPARSVRLGERRLGGGVLGAAGPPGR
ncbi:Imm7 family immunity protein [Streptomyces eurythermus]